MKVDDDDVGTGTDHDASAYGARIGDEYDDIYEGVFDTAGTVDVW